MKKVYKKIILIILILVVVIGGLALIQNKNFKEENMVVTEVAQKENNLYLKLLSYFVDMESFFCKFSSAYNAITAITGGSNPFSKFCKVAVASIVFENYDDSTGEEVKFNIRITDRKGGTYFIYEINGTDEPIKVAQNKVDTDSFVIPYVLKLNPEYSRSIKVKVCSTVNCMDPMKIINAKSRTFDFKLNAATPVLENGYLKAYDASAGKYKSLGSQTWGSNYCNCMAYAYCKAIIKNEIMHRPQEASGCLFGVRYGSETVSGVFDAIRNEIVNNGRPVVVRTNNSKEGQHFIVVSGIKEASKNLLADKLTYSDFWIINSITSENSDLPPPYEGNWQESLKNKGTFYQNALHNNNGSYEEFSDMYMYQIYNGNWDY